MLSPPLNGRIDGDLRDDWHADDRFDVPPAERPPGFVEEHDSRYPPWQFRRSP